MRDGNLNPGGSGGRGFHQTRGPGPLTTRLRKLRSWSTKQDASRSMGFAVLNARLKETEVCPTEHLNCVGVRPEDLGHYTKISVLLLEDEDVKITCFAKGKLLMAGRFAVSG